MFLYIPNWLLVLIAIVILLYVYGTWNHGYFIKHRIPFIPPLPILGNMAPIIFRRRALADQMRHIYDTFPGEKIVGFFSFNQPAFFLRDPDLIKLVTVKDFEYFTDHLLPFTEEGDPLFGKGLLLLRGDRWKEMRHTLTPAFTSSKMKAMFLLVDKCGEQMRDHVEKMCKASEDGMLTWEMKDFFTRFTNDVIATSAFGIQCDSLENPDNEFYRMGKDATDLGGTRAIIFMLYALIPKVMQVFGIGMFPKRVTTFFRTLVHGTIATREKEGIIRPDLIHLLMEARKGTLKSDVADDVTGEQQNKNKNKKFELSDDDITAQAFTFFFAGFDSIATLLCFTSYLLAIHPDIQTRLQADIDALLEEDNGKVTYEGIQRMKYLDMILSETLRLWPSTMATDRQCVRPYVLPATSTSPSIKMNPGDSIVIPSLALHRDPEFFPEPDRFDPERFSDENKHNINPFTYTPFGIGPRNCIGMRFALMETKIAMVHLLSRFSLQVVEKTPIPIRLDPTAFTLRIKDGFWLGITARSPGPSPNTVHH